MDFEWDPAKDAANVVKHGIGFDDAVFVFHYPLHIVEDSSRQEHGEIRGTAIGLLLGIVTTVIFTERHGKRRVISARRARRDERARYDRGTAVG